MTKVTSAKNIFSLICVSLLVLARRLICDGNGKGLVPGVEWRRRGCEEVLDVAELSKVSPTNDGVSDTSVYLLIVISGGSISKKKNCFVFDNF